MFLIALSRSGLVQMPAFPQTRSARIAELAVQVGWEGSDYSWEERPQGWKLRQGLGAPAGLVPGITRAELVFDERHRTLTARVSAVAGTTVYYHQTGAGDVLLGSRVQLLRQAGVRIEEDERLLPEFFAYRCLLAPATLFRNIHRVPFGGELICSFGAGRPVLNVTTMVDRLASAKRPAESSANQVARLVESLQAVVRSLVPVSDHVALLLSGGIDSSVICRLAAAEIGRRRTTSTSYPFEDPAVEVERRYALTAAAAMGFEHTHFQTTTTRYLAALIESIGLAESPVHHLQSVCLYLLQKESLGPAETIVLQGLGAGGIIGNFRNFLYLRGKPWAALAGTAPFYHLLKLAPPLTGRGRALLAKLADLRNRTPLDDPANPIWAWHQHGDVDWICRRFRVSPADIIARHLDCVRRLRADTIAETWARYALAGDEEATLAIIATMASASGRIGVFPFYDPEFLQSAAAVPWSVKLAQPENSVRKALARSVGVPALVLDRRKAGFGIRRDDWALAGGPFEPLVRLAAAIVGGEELRAVRSRDGRKAMIFWGLVNYALWKRICVNGEAPADLAAAAAADSAAQRIGPADGGQNNAVN